MREKINIGSLSLFLLLTLFLCASSTRESHLIRRAYLDILGVPPSLKEMEWYTVYNPEPYASAVGWLTNSQEKGGYKDILLSDEYKSKPPSKLSAVELETLIKYQSGNLKLSIEEACLKIVSDARTVGEDSPTDVIDYIAECLMNRSTTLEEINFLLNVYKKYPSEDEGYLKVLEEILKFKDCYTK
jgi:hypothetical protein